MKKAVFLDRDGTLIEDKGYEHRVETLKLLPGVLEGLDLLKGDYLFVIITNQSGIAKGLYTLEDFHVFNNRLLALLSKQGIRVEKTYYCPHAGGCDCKKPNTKHIEKACLEFGIDLRESWVVGDHPSDILMGKRAGCKTAYLLTGHGEKHFEEVKSAKIEPDIIAPDFLSVAKKIKDGSSSTA